MIEMVLGRVVFQDGSSHQYIYLSESQGKRGFPIVIGSNEAGEILRVVRGEEPVRPLTHQLCYSAIEALGANVERVDIVDLRENTFFAQVVLRGAGGDCTAVDARPSDAIALALRARCPLRVATTVLDQAGTEEDGKPGFPGQAS